MLFFVKPDGKSILDRKSESLCARLFTRMVPAKFWQNSNFNRTSVVENVGKLTL